MCAYSLDHITQKTLGGVWRHRVPFVLTAPLLSCRSEDRPCQRHMQMRHSKCIHNTEKSCVTDPLKTSKTCSELLKSNDAKTRVFASKASISNGASGIWWSQTGSNRRPPACKAGALPAELWPRKESWWVWEDLNFRPHPYQGCALTN